MSDKKVLTPKDREFKRFLLWLLLIYLIVLHTLIALYAKKMILKRGEEYE